MTNTTLDSADTVYGDQYDLAVGVSFLLLSILGIYSTGSFSKDVFSQGAEYKVFLGVILMFLAFFHSKIWAKFHFGTFKPYA